VPPHAPYIYIYIYTVMREGGEEAREYGRGRREEEDIIYLLIVHLPMPLVSQTMEL
jgi:hypothetical protein